MADKTCELVDCGHRACGGCGPAFAARLILKGSGPNSIVTASTGCMEVFSTPYPQTAWKVPWIHSLFENAAAVASGIESALKKQGRDEHVLCICGDGATFDIGMLCISGAFERGHNITYICYDNEAYMNTGIQRSGGNSVRCKYHYLTGGEEINRKQPSEEGSSPDPCCSRFSVCSNLFDCISE